MAFHGVKIECFLVGNILKFHVFFNAVWNLNALEDRVVMKWNVPHPRDQAPIWAKWFDDNQPNAKKEYDPDDCFVDETVEMFAGGWQHAFFSMR